MRILGAGALFLGLVQGGCAAWSGDIDFSFWAGDERKFQDQAYPHAVYIEPATVVDNDSDKDFTPGLPKFVPDYQYKMAQYCADRRVFAACITEPGKAAYVITTHLVINNFKEENTAMAVIGGVFLPPLLGMLWAFPVFLGDINADVTYTLSNPNHEKVHSQSFHVEGEFVGELTGMGYFPKFLESASQTMLAQVGPPGFVLAAQQQQQRPQVQVPVEPVRTEAPPPKKRPPGAVVAVFDVQDASGKLHADLLDQLTEYLAAQLVEVARFRVVPRNQIRTRLVEAKQETYKGCYDESCQIELGKALAAEKSLQTKLLRVGSTCAITATLFDLKSETTEAAGSVDGDCSENGLMGNIRRLAEKLAVDR